MMTTKLLGGLLAAASTAALADSGIALELNRADLDRLGVTLAPARAAEEIEVAAGPAEVVIPPAQQLVVTTTLSGVLSRLLVAEGDTVAAGQPLAEITSTELLELQRAFIEAALAAELASEQLQRDQGLHDDGIIAERRLRESQASEHAASAALDQLRQQLLLAGLTPTALDKIRQTRQLDPTLTLRATMPAVVIQQHSALGARVDALEPVYRIADLSTLWLELHVPQEQGDRIAPGMRTEASAPGRLIAGRVLQVGRVADDRSQTILVRAEINDTGAGLRVGQYLPARILAASSDQAPALAVPKAAVIHVDGQAHVFASADNSITAMPVDVLAEDATTVYVRNRFDAGIEIAVTGVATLKSVLTATADEEGQ